MEYLQVVVNMGTTESGQSEAPQFSLHVSNNQPKVGEFVNITAQVNDNNESNYAYTWFINENFQTDSTVLNKPTILKAFSTPEKWLSGLWYRISRVGFPPETILKVGEYETVIFPHSQELYEMQRKFGRLFPFASPIINHTVV